MPNIGTVSIKNRLISAPLAGISDPSFRALARSFGVGLTYTEMISSTGVYRGDPKSKTFTFVKGEHPVSIQIFGNNPEYMAFSAKHFESQGADIIDLNFGCPVKKVIKQGSGSALQRDYDLSVKVIKAVVDAIKIPLTIKIRLGWSEQEENYLKLSKEASALGVSAIALHPRYATQQFKGKADWSKFSALKKTISIPLIASGDIGSGSDIEYLLNKLGVDFVMLGRGLIGNPWLISNWLNLPKRDLLDTLYLHFSLLTENHGEKKAAILFRKYFPKYIKGHPSAKELRLISNSLSSKLDFEKLLKLLKKLSI